MTDKPFSCLGLYRDDGFLNGRLRVWQPRSGFRAGMDSILLAASIRGGGKMLEFGCGAGVAALCLMWRRPDIVSLTGIEREANLAILARQNARRNGMDGCFTAVVGDAGDRNEALGSGIYHQILANPPFFSARFSTPPTDQGRARATHDHPSVWRSWLCAARHLLAKGGRLTVILPWSVAASWLVEAQHGFGAIEIIPISTARAGLYRPIKRVILHAVKGRRTAPVLWPGLAMRRRDGTLSHAARSILFDGAALDDVRYWQDGEAGHDVDARQGREVGGW